MAPSHFRDNNHLRLTERGLEFDLLVTHSIRKEELIEERPTAERPESLVVVNPRRISARRMEAHVTNSVRNVGQGGNIALYGLPDAPKETAGERVYDLRWEMDANAWESQHLVFVCFRGRSPVGYAGGKFSVGVDEEKDIWVHIDFRLIYVFPAERGKGYGVDLSIAVGLASRELVLAAYQAAPSRSTLSVMFTADFVSPGGEQASQQVYRSLRYAMEYLADFGSRRSVRLGECSFDAGP